MRVPVHRGLGRVVGALLAISCCLLAASPAARAEQDTPFLDDLLAATGQDRADTPLSTLPPSTRDRVEALFGDAQRPSELVAGLEGAQAVALDAQGLVEAFAELQLRAEAQKLLLKSATVEERHAIVQEYAVVQAESAELWQRAEDLARELGVSSSAGVAAPAKSACGDLSSDCSCCDDVVTCPDCYWDCSITAIECGGDYASELAAAAAAAATAEFNRIKNLFASALTELQGILTDLGALAASVTTDLLNWVETTFNSLLADLADTATGVIDSLALLPGAMGLDDPAWWEPVVATWASIDIAPPCPPIGTDLSAPPFPNLGLGVVGDASTEWACRRGIDWYATIAADLAPDDVYGLPLNLVANAAYYPINYFCLCLEEQSSISFDDAQAAHRAEQSDFIAGLLHPRLDRDVHLVATQVSGDDLNAELADLQADTDALDLRADVLLVTATDLHALQDEQDDALALLGAFSMRVTIEENLVVSGPPDVMDVLVRPASEGGYLEEVRATVEDTIRMNREAGQDIHHALRELDDANAAFAAGDHAAAFDSYRRAYREAVRN